ncbi:MAG TPA: hypothetical protein VL096_20980, partial [Pirellulaceae bacterium]|nr:hypothetical protein [Pirellulaceae bacterium]
MNLFLIGCTVCLGALWGETLPQPDITPEHAARLYRITLYETYRNDRATYLERREVGDTLWNRYEAAGLPPEERAEVIAWYTQAREATLTNASDALPPLPDFTDLPKIAAEANEITPVAMTSTPREKIRVNIPPINNTPSVDVQLPREATQTGPTRFFSKLVKQAMNAGSLLDSAPVNTSSPKKQPAKIKPQLDAAPVPLPETESRLPLEPAKTEPVKTAPTKPEPKQEVAPVEQPV